MITLLFYAHYLALPYLTPFSQQRCPLPVNREGEWLGRKSYCGPGGSAECPAESRSRLCEQTAVTQHPTTELGQQGSRERFEENSAKSF